ncbi:MAG: hypothetical protein PVI03_01450 [Candidatus Thorarchaeota archaeon]|jgi:hypothetical protein
MGLWGFGKKKRPLSAKQRLKKLRQLREEARLMKEEQRQLAQIKAERKEIKQLQEQVHPSKRKRLQTLLGKVEHGGERAGRAFLRGEAKFYNEASKYHFARHGRGKGLEGLVLKKEARGVLEKKGKLKK